MKYKSLFSGQIIDLPDDAQVNPRAYVPVDQAQSQQPTVPQTTARPQQDFMTSALNFGKDALLGMASPFIRTGQNILGSLFESGRSAGINNASDMSTGLINQLNQINAQLRVEQDPMKKQALLFKSRQLSDALGKIGQTSTQLAGAANPVMNNQELASRSTIPGAAAEAARNTAGIMSYAVPFGKGANFLTKAVLPGAAQGGMFAASKEGASVNDVRNAAIGGGVTSGALYGLGKLLGGTKNAGTSIRKEVLNPQGGDAPYSPTVNAELQQFADDIGLGVGGAESKWAKLNKVWDSTESEIKGLLKSNKTQTLYKTAADELKTELESRITGMQGEGKVKTYLMGKLKSIFDHGSASDEAIYALKSDLRKELTKAFDKPVLTTMEEGKMALFKSLKNTLDISNPSIRGLNAKEDMMFTLAEGLAKNSKGFTRLAGVPVPLQPVQGAGDLLGSLMQKVGGAQGAVNAVQKSTLPIPAGQEIMKGLFKPQPSSAIPYPTGNIPTPTGKAQTGGTGGTGLELTFDKLQQILLSPKISDKTKAQFKYIYEQQQAQGEGGKQTEAQRAANQVSLLTDSALTQLPAIKDKIGIGGLGFKTAGFMSIFNQGDQEMLDFANSINQIKASIAKARAGTSFTPNEEILLNRYAPTENDSYQQLVTKLNGLKSSEAKSAMDKVNMFVNTAQ